MAPLKCRKEARRTTEQQCIVGVDHTDKLVSSLLMFHCFFVLVAPALRVSQKISACDGNFKSSNLLLTLAFLLKRTLCRK